MKEFSEIHHHLFCNFCPKIRRVCQCKFRTISFLIRAPRKTNDREGIYEHNPQLSVNFIHIFLDFLLLHIQCHFNIDIKMILSLKCSGSHFQISHLTLNLLKEAQRCDSWEYCPLELRRPAVDSIHIFEVIVFRKPPNPTPPGCNRIISTST